jgi:molecular chaperone GrpE
MHSIHEHSISKTAPSSKGNPKVDHPDEQIDTLRDTNLRLLAEFENYKRRNDKERQRLIDAADERLIGELIDVKENFERAFKSGDRGATFVQGMKLNSAKLNALLKSHGLEAYGEKGSKFDPALHDALICAPSDSVPDTFISDVLEQGYTLKGKIIKHAKVAVSSGKRRHEAESFPVLPS